MQKNKGFFEINCSWLLYTTTYSILMDWIAPKLATRNLTSRLRNIEQVCRPWFESLSSIRTFLISSKKTKEFQR